MRRVTVAATQMACTWDIEENLAKAEAKVCEAARRGAHIVLLQELFETPYFCTEQSAKHFELARTFVESCVIQRFGALAAELAVELEGLGARLSQFNERRAMMAEAALSRMTHATTENIA